MSLLNAHTYAAMIGGSFAVSSRDTDDVVAAIAADALHDARVHALIVKESGHAYYLAVPSQRVTSAQKFTTPLAAALPGHSAHQGDGVYVLRLGEQAVVVSKQGTEFFVEHLDSSAVEDIARARGLALYHVAAGDDGWALESLFGRDRRAIERYSAYWARVSSRVIAGGIATYLLLMAGEAYSLQHGGRLWQTKPSPESVKQLQYTSPLFEQLAHFQQISATVVRSGGWIEAYVWKPGKGEAFDIVMPGWISQDYIEALGPGAVSEYNIPDNLVIVRKGSIEKLSKL